MINAISHIKSQAEIVAAIYGLGPDEFIDAVVGRMEELGVNQTKLAEMTGLDQGHISNIINKKAKKLYPSTRQKLIRALWSDNLQTPSKGEVMDSFICSELKGIIEEKNKTIDILVRRVEEVESELAELKKAIPGRRAVNRQHTVSQGAPGGIERRSGIDRRTGTED